MSGFRKKETPAIGTNSRPSPTPTSRTSPTKSSTSMNGLGRSPSVRSGAGLSRPGRGSPYQRSPQTSSLNTSTTTPDEAGDETSRAEHVALVEELRNRVQKAETASEEYQRQLNLLQARLDDSHHEQGQLEDRLHQSNTTIEGLESDHAAATRQIRETEELFESERNAILHDKREQKAKMEELQAANQRLKETLAQRETRGSADGSRALSRTNSGNELGQFAPPSTQQQRDSKDNSDLITHKDRVIKSLRLELAEAQIKIMEIDSVGGGRAHEMENKLMEAKITIARLTEDNESFQLLLSEKTLNGDFSKTDTMQQSSRLGSLAEELGSEDLESPVGKTDDNRPLEAEIKSLKDQNKALALYIESIIGRLLQHKEFENLLDKTPDLMSGAPRPQTADTDKELPPPPPPKDEERPTGFLQRARSVVAGPAKRPRPMSQMLAPPPTPPPAPSPLTEDVPTPPGVPLSRSQSVRGGGHKRAQSDMPSAAPLVNQMYRGPPSTGSGGPLMSPGISQATASAARTSFFPQPTAAAAQASPNATSRVPSSSRLSRDGGPESSSNSTFSDQSGGLDSPPRNSTGNTNYTGAVMTQNRLRPLRLVQENPAKDDEIAAAAAKKKANRGSWMPAWMNQRVASNEN